MYHFIGNFDEAYILASDGYFYVVVYRKASKSYKNVSGSWYYLTMVQSGTYANSSVTFLFLFSGNNMKNYALSEENLVNSHNAHSISKSLLNGNGYMLYADSTIETNQLCKVICDFPVIFCCVYFIYSI